MGKSGPGLPVAHVWRGRRPAVETVDGERGGGLSPPGLIFPSLHQAKRMENFRLIVMSATLDAASFVSYFTGARAIYIQGRQFPVQVTPFPSCIPFHPSFALCIPPSPPQYSLPPTEPHRPLHFSSVVCSGPPPFPSMGSPKLTPTDGPLASRGR